MNFNIILTAKFQRNSKKLLKKYPSFKSELQELKKLLTENPVQGEPLGHDCYKIRLAIKSKRKGKSGGARVITHLHVTQTVVYLLTIYDKGEQENIADKELTELLKMI